MEDLGAANLTQKLIQWGAGDKACLNELLPMVEHELHRIARRHMRKERPGHTLQTTALLNEAYIRLIDQSHVNWRNRAHFFGIAANIMRQILVDHARGAGRAKRGGGACLISLDDALVFSPRKSAALIALDDALHRLAAEDPRKARVVELRYFGGLTVEETAEALQIHANSVIRDLAFAKAWLKREVESSHHPS